MAGNLDEALGLVAYLRGEGRIPEGGGALVQIVLSLAEAVDGSPENASLWREYRQAEESLRALTESGGSEFDDLIAALRDSADGAADVGAAVGGVG